MPLPLSLPLPPTTSLPLSTITSSLGYQLDTVRSLKS
jgi:hypothetical protein